MFTKVLLRFEDDEGTQMRLMIVKQPWGCPFSAGWMQSLKENWIQDLYDLDLHDGNEIIEDWTCLTGIMLIPEESDIQGVWDARKGGMA